LNPSVGTLSPVDNLTTDIRDNKVNVSWTAPYSIDVPSTDLDITYCVDIFNTSTAVPTRIYSKCDLNQTHYECEYYPLLIACAEYQVNVTAVNKVGNGSANAQVGITGIFFLLCMYVQSICLGQ